MTSPRTKGHWPRGRRRNPVALRDGTQVDRTVARIRRWCDDGYGRRAYLCDRCGLHRKSLYRWLIGHDRPARDVVRKIVRAIESAREGT